MATKQPLVWFWDTFEQCEHGCDHGCKHCNIAYVLENDSELEKVFRRLTLHHGPPTRVEASSQNWEGLFERKAGGL